MYMKTTLGKKQNRPEILKVLGLQWRSAEDHLVFDIHHISELAVSLEPTKRNVVSLLPEYMTHLEYYLHLLCVLKCYVSNYVC